MARAGAAYVVFKNLSWRWVNRQAESYENRNPPANSPMSWCGCLLASTSKMWTLLWTPPNSLQEVRLAWPAPKRAKFLYRHTA